MRAFFARARLLEVDTPQLVNSLSPTGICIRRRCAGRAAARTQFLHTSPEYAMKRLLAAGSGDIYQICHVFRGDEQGPLHNSEFTLLEWYRLGWSLEALMTRSRTAARAAPGGSGAARDTAV